MWYELHVWNANYWREKYSFVFFIYFFLFSLIFFVIFVCLNVSINDFKTTRNAQQTVCFHYSADLWTVKKYCVLNDNDKNIGRPFTMCFWFLFTSLFGRCQPMKRQQCIVIGFSYIEPNRHIGEINRFHFCFVWSACEHPFQSVYVCSSSRSRQDIVRSRQGFLFDCHVFQPQINTMMMMMESVLTPGQLHRTDTHTHHSNYKLTY